MSTTWRLARAFTGALLAGALAGIVLLVMVPVALGWRPYTILTGSMRPNIQPGDVVMDRPIPVPDMHVGDVVTFTDPTRGGKLVTHRIRSVAHGKEFTSVETRGDANNTSERWTIQTKDRIGRVVFVIPKVGHVANLIRNPAGILILVVLPVLGLAFLALRSIWRDDDEDDDPGTGNEPDGQMQLPFAPDAPADRTPHTAPDAAARPGR